MISPDMNQVRGRFPALAREIDGRPVAFLDAPGGSQVPDVVIEAMAGYLRRSNANVHGAFETSRETDALIDEAHRAAADLLNADPDEVVFGPNATTLLLSISRSIARTLGPGDEVVVTRLDHDANVRPWLLAAKDAGASVRWVDIRDDVTLDGSSFEASLNERTKVVAFTLASNAVGTIPPATELVRIVRERTDAIIACDGVHLAQHRRIDARGIGADIVVCSPYKIFGPHLGILYGRRELLEKLDPYKVRPASDALPHAFETGTQNHEAFAGWVAAVDYLVRLGDSTSNRREALAASFTDVIEPWERELAARFLEGITPMPHVRLYGIAALDRLHERTPTFAVRVGDRHPFETAKLLADRGIFVWDGHYYALELMERLGLQETGGAVRIGFCHYNTPDEADRTLEELAGLG
jgi:cysteine desulfurase family protein (TIGR01976 family)